MKDLLLHSLGVRLDGHGEIAGWFLAWRNLDALPWVSGGFVVLAGLAWWSHWLGTRELIAGWQRRVLLTLRLVLLALLGVLVLRPVLTVRVAATIRRTVLLLVDASASMKITDPRVSPDDLKRAAIATGQLDARAGLKSSPPTDATLAYKPRVELVRAVFSNPDLDLIRRIERDFDLAPFTFGEEMAEAIAPPSPAEPDGKHALQRWLDALNPAAPRTALGDSLRELIHRKRGQPLAGVIVVSDGASNAGAAPLEAVRVAAEEGIPVFTYGVGITTPRDIVLPSLFAQDVAFAKDELPVAVRVRGQGLRGQGARLTLRLAPQGSPAGEGAEVAAEEISFSSDDEFTVNLRFTPPESGNFELRASIAPRDDEAVRDNNAASQPLRVVDSKIKVLYVEQGPRWEFRYVHAALMRDRRLTVKTVLREADAAVADGTIFLPKFPEKKEDLFAYDLVLLGDVGASDFAPGELTALDEFVSRFGGALVLLAGPLANPNGWKSSPLEKMLPVELAEAAPGAARPTALELTTQGRTSPLLKLAASEEENAALWAGFPRVQWSARVGRAKPAAQVLVVDPDPERATRFGKMPVVALQQHGLGQVLYVGTDNTWRWRRNENEPLHAALWGQIMQRLGMPHLLGGTKRTQLSVDKQGYTTGERVAVFARLYNEDFSPLREASVAANVGTKNGAQKWDVALRAVPEQPGMYRGEFTAIAPGTMLFSVRRDADTSLEFNVAEPHFELGETAMNEPLLQKLADTSGGAFFREETLHKLPETIRAKAERVESVTDGELWASPAFFALLLLVASVEWMMRKRWQLK